VIGIDGVDGCGKSTLASLIAERLGWNVVSVDDYLEQDRDTYVAHVRTSDLRAQTANATPTIVEGVCVLAVCQAANLPLDLLVYVKRVRADGSWLDEDECDTAIADVETLVQSLEEQVSKVHRHMNPDERGMSEFLCEDH
jgi:broad-specificity NMP kinase